MKKKHVIICPEDIVNSVADALQYISYYHPEDFIRSLADAWRKEQSQYARRALEQILVNSRMCALGKRPICQDTGIVVLFVRIGKYVFIDSEKTLGCLLNEGVRRAYCNSDNPLRASIVDPPFGRRKNTGDNTPCVIHYEYDNSSEIEIIVASKGGGSENKARFAVLNPGAEVSDWVVEQVKHMGAGWCPPGILGIGIGGSPEKALLLAKRAMMIPITPLSKADHNDSVDRLRVEIANRVNQLGIGAQGLGGLTTVLDVKILHHPTHAASLPVAVIPNCAATRHTHFTLNGSGAARFDPPDLSIWPKIDWSASTQGTSVDLDSLTHEQMRNWKAGDTLLLSGKIFTARDAAHKRLVENFRSGKGMPEGLDLSGKILYYVGPVNAVRDEVIGPAGPTTATRMDPYLDELIEHSGILATIGKAERGPTGLKALRKNKSCYLIAVGGAAFLIAQAIKKSRIVAFEDMGMEAIYEFVIENMPVTVAVDTHGTSIHEQGPKQWEGKSQTLLLPTIPEHL